jgi:hypothetical protein
VLTVTTLADVSVFFTPTREPAAAFAGNVTVNGPPAAFASTISETFAT